MAKKREFRLALPMPPRHYAAAYLAAKPHGKEAQRKALEGLPVEWRELVRKHIELIEEKQRLRGVR